ncbi:N-methyl-L-tryptophan oxidase [Actinomycetes bacterium KLBMP 9797]
MSFDPVTLRAATPGTRHARHFNAAGAALPSESVLSTIVEHLRLEARIGGYEAAEAARERGTATYASAARLLGAQPDDIALVESATVAWHRAVDALPLRPGDRILASASSYVSSALHLLELRRTRGVTVEVLPCDDTGGVDLDALEKALRAPAALVTVAHVPTSSALVEPVAAIGARTTAAGVPLLLDATQSVGQFPVDVAAIGCDMLMTTGRKFLRGPRGTGLLYVSPALRAALRPPHPDVRGARWTSDEGYDVEAGARRYETWEAAHALRLGLGAALAEALDLGVDRIGGYTAGLAARLRAGLAAVPGVRLVDPPAGGGAIVTFVRDGEEPRDTVRRLRAAGVHVVPIPASHGQWDLGRRGLPAVVRASVHVYNNDDDVRAFTEALAPSQSRRPSRSPSTMKDALIMDRADVVVIGAGVHGSSTAWHLARRGARVIQLDRFPDGHTEGSSHGHTRMIRRAYPNESWDALVDLAYRGWAELADAAGRPLVTTTGGLYARPAGMAGSLRGPGCETVDAARAAELFPALRLPPDVTAVYDPAAGVIDAAAAMRALRELAAAHGVDRRPACPALRWAATGAGVTVDTPQGTIHADRLVIAAGPWTGSLVPELATHLDVRRIVNVHVGASEPARLAPPHLGAFSVEMPGVGLLYGIPAFDGRAVKIGLDHGPPDDPHRPQSPPTAAERATLLDLARRLLPDADGDVIASIACRYTMAPRNRFLVGPLPETPRVLVVAACSGHGFKFGPALGAILADAALDTPPILQFSASISGIPA